MRRRLLLLLGLGVLASALVALRDVQLNDEGLMLQATARIADGQVPYRDFWWFYPPGQPLVLAGLWKLFGPSLLTWRLLRVLANATVAVLAYALARRRAEERWALAAWAAALLAMLYPSGPHPFPVALAFALGALLAFEDRPALAGALTGACAFWRIEFALILALGILLSGGGRRFAGWAAATAAVLYVPIVALAGPGRAWNLLVDYPATDFRRYQSLPFPLAYHGPLDTSGPSGFASHSLEPMLLHFLPLVLVLGLGAGLAAWSWEGTRRATALFALGTLAYMLVRTDLFHTAPLAVMVCVLAAWAAARPPYLAVAVAAVAALAYVTVEGLDRVALVLREHTVALDLPVAHGVRVPQSQARDLQAVVAAAGAPGTPLYVTGLRSDRVTAGAPLLYVLTGRPNPTRYDIAAPGVVTSTAVQREIIADLEGTRTPLVIRWLDPRTAAPEPNAAGRERGATLLDAYLARAYSPWKRVGSFLLVKRRE